MREIEQADIVNCSLYSSFLLKAFSGALSILTRWRCWDGRKESARRSAVAVISGDHELLVNIRQYIGLAMIVFEIDICAIKVIHIIIGNTNSLLHYHHDNSALNPYALLNFII